MIWKRLLENRCPKCLPGRKLEVIKISGSGYTFAVCQSKKCGFQIRVQVMERVIRDIKENKEKYSSDRIEEARLSDEDPENDFIF